MTIEKEQFNKKFNLMVHRIWDIQNRISELREFEKQWKNVFDCLKEMTGEECKINILNQTALRDFRWDKYHILVSDILSLHENELKSENKDSVIHQTIHFLEVLSPESYLDPEYKVNFIDYSDYILSEEQKAERLEEMRKSDAQRTHSFKNDALKRLFPRISDDFKITDTDVRHLLSKISSLAGDVRGMRHYFNHKYEDDVRERYESHMKKFDLDDLEKIANKIFEIVGDLGLVYKSSSYGKAEFSSSTYISDRIDLILFGSIKGAVARFYEVADDEDYYWQAREKYFKSKNILSIVSK